MDLNRILELNDAYQHSHDNIVNLIQKILVNGEITNEDVNDMEDGMGKNDENYNELNKAQQEELKKDYNDKLDDLQNTKLDIDVDTIVNLLTNGGRNSALYVDDNKNIILNAAKLSELNQVQLNIDTANKRIDSVIADTEITQDDGSKVKLKVLFSTLDQRVDGITTTVGEIQGTAKDANSKAESAVTKATQAQQTAEKFQWLVKTGSTQSSITLTDAVITAIANSDIKLKAKQITLEGLVTANGNFKILEDGSIVATNGKFTGEINADKGKISSDLEVDGMNVSGNLSADILNVRKINCPDLSTGLTSDINITVNPGATNATNIFVNNGVFTSLQTCIESIPKNLNGYTVSITVSSQITENITIRGFNGGTLYIKFDANCLGYIAGFDCSAQVLLQGAGSSTQTLVSNYRTTGNVNMRVAGNVNANLVQTVPPGAVLLLTDITSEGWGYTTYNGKSGWMSTNTSYMVKEEVYQTTGTSTIIQPSTLITQDGKNYGTVFRNCTYAALFELEVYSKTGNTLNYALGSIRGSYVDLEDIKVSGSENGIAAERGGRVFESNVTGKVNGIAQNANCSGTIYIQDGTTINGTISKDNCSQVIYSESGVNKDTTSNVGTNDNTTTATSTVTITSNGGNSYRHNVYTGWKNDNTVRQGDYGYGDCDGIWLFGTQFASKLKGKNITQITLTVTRQSGGIYGAVTSTLKMHNHSTQPGGAPTYINGWSKTFSVAVNTTTTITITDSAVLTAIKNGTCQGFGLQGTYDSSHYAVFSGNCTLIATIH